MCVSMGSSRPAPPPPPPPPPAPPVLEQVAPVLADKPKKSKSQRDKTGTKDNRYAPDSGGHVTPDKANHLGGINKKK